MMDMGFMYWVEWAELGMGCMGEGGRYHQPGLGILIRNGQG